MNLDLFLARKSFNQDKKTRILRQMQRLNKAGISTSVTLDMLYDLYSQNGKKPKGATAMAVNEWRKRYKGGRPLSSAMHGWITLSEEMIIEAGEQSDHLDEAMADALEASAATKRIRKTVRNAFIYPVAMLIAVCLILWGFNAKIVPTFAEIVQPVLWTGNAARMYALSEFVVGWMPIAIPALLALIVLIVMALPRYTGPARVTLDKFPPFSIYKVIAGASFMMSLRGFITAGVTIPEALRRIARGSNPYIKSRTLAILAQVNAGRNLGVGMTKAGHNFPDPDINGEISIYAGLGDFDDNLDVLAKEWIEGSVERVQASSRVLSNLALVLLAGIIMFMVLSMFELQDIIARSTGV